MLRETSPRPFWSPTKRPSTSAARAIGVNDSFAAATAVVVALLTGTVVQSFGLPATGLMAVLMVMVPLPMLLLPWDNRANRQPRTTATIEPVGPVQSKR